MITDTTSTDPLVEALATRLRLIDLIAWQRIATWAEQSELSFEDLRLLLALAAKMDDGPATVSDLAGLGRLPARRRLPRHPKAPGSRLPP